MATIQTFNNGETGASFRSKINDNFTALNTDKLETTNLKTVNGNSLVGSGDIAIPALIDGDKGDITVSSSTTVWTIDNDTVTNQKLANMSNGTIKGRTTAGSGDPEDLTGTQATALLDTATTSLKGLMSSADKTKLDSMQSSWNYVNLSQVSNTGSSQETLYTATLPANTLGANGVIEGDIFFSNISTSITTRYVNIELYLGGLNASFQINPASTSNFNLGGVVKFRISGTGSTSSQKLEIISSLSTADYGGGTGLPTGMYGYTNTTIDTTSTQTITIKTTPSGSSITRIAESIVIRKII